MTQVGELPVCLPTGYFFIFFFYYYYSRAIQKQSYNTHSLRLQVFFFSAGTKRVKVCHRVSGKALAMAQSIYNYTRIDSPRTAATFVEVIYWKTTHLFGISGKMIRSFRIVRTGNKTREFELSWHTLYFILYYSEGYDEQSFECFSHKKISIIIRTRVSQRIYKLIFRVFSTHTHAQVNMCSDTSMACYQSVFQWTLTACQIPSSTLTTR